LQVAPLNGNVTTGDIINVTSGTNRQSFTATGNAYYGATSIPVSATPTFSYPIGSAVSNSNANPPGYGPSTTALNSDTTDTISNFDTSKGYSGRVELTPVSGNQTAPAAVTDLTHGSSRTFIIGVYFPAAPGISQNQLQGLASTFGVTWHIDQ
jgi:hypothetical protein